MGLSCLKGGNGSQSRSCQGLEGFKLHMNGEGDKTKPAKDEPREMKMRLGVRQGT